MTSNRPTSDELIAKMAADPSVPQVTDDIRGRKHAMPLTAALVRIQELHRDHPPEDVEALALEQCRILYDDYPRFFTKAVQHPEEIPMLQEMIAVIGKIEKGELDQHTGSVVVGTMLKKRFIDKDMPELAEASETAPKISYAEWKDAGKRGGKLM